MSEGLCGHEHSADHKDRSDSDQPRSELTGRSRHRPDSPLRVRIASVQLGGSSPNVQRRANNDRYSENGGRHTKEAQSEVRTRSNHAVVLPQSLGPDRPPLGI
jgi:hypothetical protein